MTIKSRRNASPKMQIELFFHHFTEELPKCSPMAKHGVVPDVKSKTRRMKTGRVAMAMSGASAVQMASVKCDGEEQSSC